MLLWEHCTTPTTSQLHYYSKQQTGDKSISDISFLQSFSMICKTPPESHANFRRRSKRPHESNQGFTNRKSATYASDQKMVSHSKGIVFTPKGFLTNKTADAQIFMPTSTTQQCVSNAEWQAWSMWFVQSREAWLNFMGMNLTKVTIVKENWQTSLMLLWIKVKVGNFLLNRISVF